MFGFDAIFEFIINYGYLIIIPIAIIEGPIITVISAFLVSQGYFNPFIMYFVLILGDIIGDVLYYVLGRFGKKSFLIKWGHKFGVTNERILKIQDHFHVHSGKTLLFGKWFHSVGSVILISAGISGMSIWKFIFYNLIGSLPKTLVLFLIGYYLGHAYEKINSYIDIFVVITLSMVAISVGVYLYFKYKKRRTNNFLTPPTF
jgi:membrane protein DedA with SNARE-associated domain